MNVIKRSGKKELLDYRKIEEVINIAIGGLEDVSLSDILVHAKIQFYDGISSKDIHKTIINSAADLINLENPNYQYVAGRLLYLDLKKSFEYSHTNFQTLITQNVADGVYAKDLLKYSVKDIKELENFFQHNKFSYSYTFASLKQLQTKYLIKNKELPHHMYMCIAMILCIKTKDLNEVKELYLSLMRHEISLASPLLVSCRTPQKQFSSCALLETGDSLDSISKTVGMILKYVSQKAGFGIHIGNIRGLGANIRKGDVTHTGIIPFIKLISSAVKSCSQGGFRGGSATLFYPYWHYEIEDLLVLKNNRGTEDNRVRHADYCVQLDEYFYDAVKKDKNIYLFSPEEAVELQELFYSDVAAKDMEALLKKLAKTNIRKKTIKARELFSNIIQQRAETGRIYIQNIHHCNRNTVFTKSMPIKMSNLCMEICLPTQPSECEHVGHMALCTLGAVNVGVLDSKNMHKKLERVTENLVFSLNNVLNYQSYLCDETKKSTKEIRSLGIGVTNFAYFLAKHETTYGEEVSKILTKRLFSNLQYFCVKASIKYAKLYPKYKVNSSKFNYLEKIKFMQLNTDDDFDWDNLIKDYKKYGMANTTLTALMPCESSSLVLNSTNGIEPIRNLEITKESKAGIVRMIVPEASKYKEYYTDCWSVGNAEYLSLVGIMQMFVDQSISTNTYYKSSNYKDGKVAAHDVAKDIMLAESLGIKTLYYHNTHDGSANIDESCESCTI